MNFRADVTNWVICSALQLATLASSICSTLHCKAYSPVDEWLICSIVALMIEHDFCSILGPVQPNVGDSLSLVFAIYSISASRSVDNSCKICLYKVQKT